MDIDMPERDGLETTKNIYDKFQINEKKNIKIVGCTGYSDVEMI